MDTKRIPISTQCACLDDDGNAWMFSNDFNALFFMDIKTKIIEYVTSIDETDFFESELYNEAIYFQKKIFLFPCRAKSIVIYDVYEKTVRYVSLDKSNVYYNIVLIEKNKVLLYPIVYSNCSYFFNLETFECKTCLIDYGENEQLIRDKIVRGKAYCDGKAYFVIDNTNKYIVFDVISKNVRIQCVEKENLLFDVTSDGELLYMMRADGDAYDIYKRNKYVKTCKLIDGVTDEHKASFYNMSYVYNTVIKGNIIVSIPLKKQPLVLMCDGILKKIFLQEQNIKNYIDEYQPIYVCKCIKENVVLFPYHGRSMIIINLQTEKIEYLDIEIDKLSFFQLAKNKKNNIIYEHQIGLENFLYLENDVKKQREDIIGKIIWKAYN